MESKIHSTIVITSILVFALIVVTGISSTLAFVDVLAQEGAITPEGSVNDTMSGQNASQWTTNATLAFAQEDMPGGDAGVIDGTTNTTGGLTDGKSGETGTGNGGQ